MLGILVSAIQFGKTWKYMLITTAFVYLVGAVLYEFYYEQAEAILPHIMKGSNINKEHTRTTPKADFVTEVYRTYTKISNVTYSNNNETGIRNKTPENITSGIHVEHHIVGHTSHLGNGSNATIFMNNGSSLVNKLAGNITLDIHQEHPILGHTGDLGNVKETSNHLIKIAIGGGITSAKLSGITPENIPAKFVLFSLFLPSFCKTISSGYFYQFYWAYDHSDKVFSNKTLLAAFQEQFIQRTNDLCHEKENTSISIHMVQCSHKKDPAWAQNDAMMEAYLDGMDYYYRINDDTVLQTPGWVDAFIDTLSSYKPPYVGVVGPKHSGGNTGILTYDFVHSTHINIFGFYYPRIFTDWYADTWITHVYKPDNMKKLSKIAVKHTMRMGQRYVHHRAKGKSLTGEVHAGRELIQRYIQHKENTSLQYAPKGSKVISMSLCGNDPKFTMGAIRNAQLLPVIFPGWVLKIWTGKDQQNQPPRRVLSTLQRLGADIIFINYSIPCTQWSFLVADDDRIDVFLVRNAESRLSDRDAGVVNHWLKENSGAFYCIRDHPKHSATPIVEGLWGGKPKLLQPLLKSSMLKLLMDFAQENATSDDSFLQNRLWPLVKERAFCHDSVSCSKWKSAHKFPMKRKPNLEYLSEKFNIYQQSLQISDKTVLSVNDTECVSSSTSKSWFSWIIN